MGQLLDRGVDLFNRGDYFDAHEAFEDLWRGSSGGDRDLWQGLAQVCAGLHKWRRGNPGVAARLIRRGLGRIERHARAAPPPIAGTDPATGEALGNRCGGSAPASPAPFTGRDGPLNLSLLVRDLLAAADRLDRGLPMTAPRILPVQG